MNFKLKRLASALLLPIAPIVLAGASTFALADADYDRIKKDVTVMAKILEGSFTTDRNHHRRSVAVESSYLASQGVVFRIKGYGSGSFSLSFNSDDDNEVFVFNGTDVMPPLPPVPAMPAIRGTISAEIAEALENVDFAWSGDWEDGDFMVELDDETREAIRDVARDARDIEREISENRIELIHVDGPDERKELEKNLAKLSEQLKVMQSKRTKLEESLEAQRKKAREQREALRTKVLEQRKAQNEALQKHVMQSLCDYGSTLKNLPDKDHISIILSRSGTEDQQVYVFDKKQVTECRGSGEALSKQATSYLF